MRTMGSRSTTGTTATTGAGRGNGASMAVHAFSLLNLCFFVVLTAVAGHLYAGLVTNKADALRVFARATNASYTLLISLVTGAVGIATTLFGVLMIPTWSEVARIASLAVNIISLALATLATASAGRSMRSGQDDGPNDYFKQLRVMYAFDYCLMILMLVYVVLLAIARVHYHPTTVVGGHNGVHNGVHGHKNVDVNASTDTARTNGATMA